MFKHIKSISSIVPLTGRFQVPLTFGSLQSLTLNNDRFSSRNMATNSTEREKTWKVKKLLIVGLGNHDYKGTRHSVGMQAVDKLAAQLQINWQKDKNFAGFVTTTKLQDGTTLILLKSKLPMNVNGTSVAKTASHYGINAEDVYLIHDDIDKKLGKLSLKEGGGANGHNGVRSVMNSLRSDVMTRIRIGVDRPSSKSEVSDYVLSRFPPEEQKLINTVIQESLQKIAEHMSKHSSQELKKILNENKDNILSQGLRGVS